MRDSNLFFSLKKVKRNQGISFRWWVWYWQSVYYAPDLEDVAACVREEERLAVLVNTEFCKLPDAVHLRWWHSRRRARRRQQRDIQRRVRISSGSCVCSFVFGSILYCAYLEVGNWSILGYLKGHIIMLLVLLLFFNWYINIFIWYINWWCIGEFAQLFVYFWIVWCASSDLSIVLWWRCFFFLVLFSDARAVIRAVFAGCFFGMY